MENWVRYNLMGGNIYLKKHVIPHIFECQIDGKLSLTEGALMKHKSQRVFNEDLTEGKPAVQGDIRNPDCVLSEQLNLIDNMQTRSRSAGHHNRDLKLRARTIPMHCCVSGCRSNYRYSSQRESSHVPVFSFPVNEDDHHSWMATIPRENQKPCKYDVVCVKHFDRTKLSYEGTYLDAGGMEITRPILMPGAVPTIFKARPKPRARVAKDRKPLAKSHMPKVKLTETDSFQPTTRDSYACKQISRIPSGQEDTSSGIHNSESNLPTEPSCLGKCELLNTDVIPALSLPVGKENGFKIVSVESIMQKRVECVASPQVPDKLKVDELDVSPLQELDKDLQNIGQCDDGNWFPCFDCGSTYANSADLEEHNLLCGVPNDETGQLMEQSRTPPNVSCDPELRRSPAADWIHDHTYTKRPTARVVHNTYPNIGSGDKRYQCSLCGKIYVGKLYFMNHVKLRTCERRFVCEYCGKTFVFSSQLSTHLTTHLEDRPLQCDICLKQFLNMSKFDRHQRNHEDGQPFFCIKCAERFSNKLRLWRHERQMHPNK